MKYVIMICNGPTPLAEGAPETEAWIQELFAWYEKWDSKVADAGATLYGPETAKTIRSSGITDGPFIETKEAIGGFSILEAETIDEAVDIAKTWPGVDRGWVTIEVRPVDPSM